MSFLKINKTDLTSTVDKIKEEIKTSQDDLTSISDWCTNHIKTVPDYSDLYNEYVSNHESYYPHQPESYANSKIDQVKLYNKAINALKEAADGYVEPFGSSSTNIQSEVDKVINAVDAFEAIDVEPIEETPVTANNDDVGDYGEVKAFDTEDNGVSEDEEKPDTNPNVSGTNSSDSGTGTDSGGASSETAVMGQEAAEEELIDDEFGGYGDGVVDSTNTSDNGVTEDGSQANQDTNVNNQDSQDNGVNQDDARTNQEANVNGQSNQDNGTNEDGQKIDSNGNVNGQGNQDNGITTDDAHEATSADLIGTSGSMVNQLVDNDGTLQMEDLASIGTATVAMLGLTGLGAEENGGDTFLSNLATGLDDDRTLPNADIDVFEHPDHLSDGAINLSAGDGKWTSYEDAQAAGFGDILTEDAFLSAKASGDPNLVGYENYQDYLDAMYQQNMGGGLGTIGGWTSYEDAIAAGFGGSIMSENEFANALANGDPSVTGYSSYQDYLNAMFDKYVGAGANGNGAFNFQPADNMDGQNGDVNGTSFAAGIGALGGAAAVGGLAAGAAMGMSGTSDDMYNAGTGFNGQLAGGHNSISDFFFGYVEETDEEEKKKQSLRERVAMILSSATSLSSLVTFAFANIGMIDPIWFTVSILMFALALLYFNLVIDKKNKRREELEFMKKASVRRGFFNQNEPQTAPSSKEADWIFYGMILLSTSAFILKTYDVISWLLFIILLILFILIIIAYKILKKKFGENNKGVPY